MCHPGAPKATKFLSIKTASYWILGLLVVFGHNFPRLFFWQLNNLLPTYYSSNVKGLVFISSSSIKGNLCNNWIKLSRNIRNEWHKILILGFFFNIHMKYLVMILFPFYSFFPTLFLLPDSRHFSEKFPLLNFFTLLYSCCLFKFSNVTSPKNWLLHKLS